MTRQPKSVTRQRRERRDLSDQSIDVEPMQKPADLGAALAGIVVQ